MKKILIVVISIILVNHLAAQTLQQTVRGKIVDKDTQQPLVGATISIEADVAAVTDSLGQFRLSLPIGRYYLKADYLGYEPYVILDMLVEASKEVVQYIELQESAEELSNITVVAKRDIVTPISVNTISVEQTQRFAATFYDPARMATSFAGVVGANDQANNLIVRGNSPNAVVWRLEGVDIVNPNHTPNAGTFSDRVTQSGGGVNILSAQLLDNSLFLTSAFPSEYGNALGGVLDMKLRKGNNEQKETTFQIGLIGIDLATEGPFSKNSNASYLINSRYSTLGILSAMGVDLGDEKIGFLDISGNLYLPTQNAGTFTLFWVIGESSNLFQAQRDTAAWEFQKDRFDIDFYSNTVIGGGTHTISLGDQTSLKTVFAASNLQSERLGSILDNNYNPTLIEEDNILNTRLSLRSTLTHKFNAKAKLTGGLMTTQLLNSISSTALGQLVASGESSGILFQPFANLHLNLSEKLSINGGLHYMYYTFNNTQSVEPRLALKWIWNERQFLTAAYGRHGQLQAPSVYFSINDQTSGNPNQSLEMTKADHFVVGYNYFLRSSTRLKLEGYYQRLFDVPIINDPSRSYATINELEGFTTEVLENAGTGRNMGIEASLQQYFRNDMYFLLTGSLYDSKYTGGDGILRNTRYNGNYIVNLTGGREYDWTNKKGKEKTLGLNTRIVYLGGMRATPIDVMASQAANTTIFIESLAYSEQLGDYTKIDFRIYYKTNKPNRTSTLALDIQNLTNAQNIAFNYFDTEAGEIITKYQLGLIPLLTYRLEF